MNNTTQTHLAFTRRNLDDACEYLSRAMHSLSDAYCTADSDKDRDRLCKARGKVATLQHKVTRIALAMHSI